MAETELKIKVVTEGSQEASAELQNFNNNLQTISGTAQEAGQSVETLTTTVTTNTEAVKNNTKSEIENILKREESRHIAELLTGTVKTLAESIGQAGSISNDAARQTAIMSAGWNAAKGAITAFNPVVGGAVSAIEAVITSIVEFQEAQERLRLSTQATSELFRTRYNVDLTATKQVVRGLVDEMELQRIAIEAQRNGLQLTSELYANIAVAAQRLSAQTGDDLATSIRKVTEAMASGNANALEDYGINIGEASTQTEILANATQDLERRFSTSRTSIEQNREALIAQGATVEMVDEAIQNQTISAASLDGHERNRLRHIIEMNDAYNESYQALRDFEAGMDSASEATRRQIEALQELIATNGTLNSQPNMTGLGGEDLNAMIQEEQERRRAARRGRGGGGGGNRQDPETMAEAMQRLIGLQNESNNLFSTARDILQEQYDIQADSARIESERNHNEVLRTNEMRMQTEELNRQKDAITLQGQMQAQAQRLQEERNKTQQNMNMGLGTANELMGMGANILQISHKNGKKAAKEALKEWLKSFAIQEALRGGASLAEAIGLTFTNPPAAGSKYTESAYHFALAASAGGASAAIKGGGGGGGSKAPAKEDSGVKASGGGSGGSGAPSNITVNVTGTALLTQGQIGREVQNALQAYQSRY